MTQTLALVQHQEALVEKFWSRVTKEGPVPAFRPELGPCWVWTAYVSKSGYSRFRYGGQVGYGHRFAYEVLIGPIPPKLTIDHLCRVRHCVRPSHLEVVTYAENNRRGFVARGYVLGSRAPRRRKPSQRLYQVCHRCQRVKSGVKCRLCAGCGYILKNIVSVSDAGVLV